jgi:hypothetical protein
MPVANDFKTIMVQATVYTPGLQFRSGKVLAHFLTQYPDKITGEPLSIPMPSRAPPEMPHLVLPSEDMSFRLQVGPGRFDAIREADDLSPEAIVEFLRFATEAATGYLRETQAKVGRLACVLHRAVPHDNPARAIAEHFCQPRWLADPLNRPSDFELHAAKQFPLGGVVVNSWFRCKSPVLKLGEVGVPFKAIFVEQDFNTLVEELETRTFTHDQISRFFELAPAEFRRVLERYFPAGGPANA